MVAQQKFFKLMSPCGCLSLLLVVGLGTGIEHLISTSWNQAQQREKIHNFSLAEKRQAKQKADQDNQDDPNCEKRGCVPNPRYVL
ncbi:MULTISPECIES: hypothetical protein [Planktothricoides]|uniref:Secreted protein n=2 Tax=Planktothricoides raciborskii TaxID=132608 RepID=A0AAU8JKG2_9CYAN|nr:MULTISPECIES: hypothetical protein [Planktothricoides]KOR33790.1 hypothetical protein AM228_27785 [Planktothricoides sp. SR001]MBD2547840.1 hypothetical protein [Planktothricoides raciborskii FACHB-1370]MBD2586274.1 hypothetical protein [Planktothricoides raciborskii FACHB-1261]